MPKTILTHATLLDGSAACTPMPEMNIVVEGDRITGIFPGELSPEMEDESSRILDIHGHYVIPGMINAGVCLAETGEPGKKGLFKKEFGKPAGRNPISMASYRLTTSNQAAATVTTGVTSVLNCCMDPGVEALVRDWVNMANVDGTRIHGGSRVVTAGNVPQTLWAEIEKTKPQVVWLDPASVEEELPAVCDQLHTLGCRTAMGSDDPKVLKRGAASGVDILTGRSTWQHLPALMEEYPEHAWLVPSLSVLVPEAIRDSGARKELQAAAAMLKLSEAKGICVGIGSDAGREGILHTEFWKEIFWLQAVTEADPMQVLHWITGGNARFCGLELAGAVREGSWADLVVLPRNPQEDPMAYSEPGMLLVRGVISVPKPEPKTKRQMEEERVSREGILASRSQVHALACE